MQRKVIRHSFNRATIGLCLIAVFGGCTHKKPLEDVIDATSGFKLTMWKADVADDFSFQEWHDFDEAVQEIKLDVMISGEATGSDAVMNAACARIDSKTVRDALVYGYDLKLKRLRAEKEKIGGFYEINQKFKTHEGDEESARYLENLREEQKRRLESLDQQIEQALEVLQRRGLSEPKTPAQPKVANA